MAGLRDALITRTRSARFSFFTEEVELRDTDVSQYTVRVTDAGHGQVTVSVVAACLRPLRLHWATAESPGGSWKAPPHGWTTRPPHSADGGGGAWVTQFEKLEGDLQAVDVTLQPKRPHFAFVLRTDHDRFIKRDGRDMYLPLTPPASPKPPKEEPPPSAPPVPPSVAALEGVLADRAPPGSSPVFLSSGELQHEGVTAFAVHVVGGLDGGSRVLVAVASEGPISLHWGLCDHVGGAWKRPPSGWFVSGPTPQPLQDPSGGGAGAELTAFQEVDPGKLQLLELSLPPSPATILAFVLRTAKDRYVKHKGRDMLAALSQEGVDELGGHKGGGRKKLPLKDSPRKRRYQAPSPSTPSDDQAFGAPEVYGDDDEDSDEIDMDEEEEDDFQEEVEGGKVRCPAKSAPTRLERKDWPLDAARCECGAIGGSGTFDEGLAEEVVRGEHDCQRSLMHRYNFLADRLGRAAERGQDGLVVLFVWLRFMALRQLVINRNYNVKPREISAAQERATSFLAGLHNSRADLRDLVRLTMSTIGRGATGDVGQRIRDEILEVQKRNNCKGGMMEEWHQKLHNNTCPDDVAICEALMEYIRSGLDITAYWNRLAQDNITRQRLASYDRKITSEPHFRRDQCQGLMADLRRYLKTLKAVHSGADLDSAVGAVFGYSRDSCKGIAISIDPVPEVATPRLRMLLERLRRSRQSARSAAADGPPSPLPALEAIVEARWELQPWTCPGGRSVAGGRLKDVIYLDLALESTLRTAVEGCLAQVSSLPPADALAVVGLALESVVLSAGGNEELLLCLKDWRQAVSRARGGGGEWALRAHSVTDRIRRALADQSERWTNALVPAATRLGERLGVDGQVLRLFAEEVIRGAPAAPLSQLLRAIDPVLRQAASLGAWLVISQAEACGRIVCVHDLAGVQFHAYDEATVLVAQHVGGDEEIPTGVVAVLTPDAPDMLSHVAVRARNERRLFASCFDAEVLRELQAMQGAFVHCKPSQAGDSVQVKSRAPSTAPELTGPAHPPPGEGMKGKLELQRKKHCGSYALPSSKLSLDVAGGKSCNLNGLRGRLPSWVHLPASVAIPFESFEVALADPVNADVAQRLLRSRESLQRLGGGEEQALAATLADIRKAVREMRPPPDMVAQLRAAFEAERMPWAAGPKGEPCDPAAWDAIAGVWASKWNDRAYLSCRKVGIDHSDVSMAVLCQEVVQAKYAFVIHTINPSNGDKGEIYAELVCGLGETLVGNYAGRALSFTARKGDTSAVEVKGFPSKSVGLYTDRPTLIFRSDSNAEDLEGFAGAGLYDSIIMNGHVQRPVDYSSEPLLCDTELRNRLLGKIAEVGRLVEEALGSPQDIEGAVDKDGRIFVVQTRPQM